MAGLDIFGRPAQMPVEREKPGMLARAIVMHLTGRGAGAQERLVRLLVLRVMRAAAQIVVRQAQIGKPAIDALGMDRRAVVRGAREGEVLGRQPMRIRSATGEKRQRLQHLAGRARQDRFGRVAPSLDNRAACVTNHGMTQMNALGPRAAPDFGKGDSLGHRFTPADRGTGGICGNPPIASFTSRVFQANIAMSRQNWSHIKIFP